PGDGARPLVSGGEGGEGHALDADRDRTDPRRVRAVAELTLVVAAPAPDGAVLEQAAGVIEAGGEAAADGLGGRRTGGGITGSGTARHRRRGGDDDQGNPRHRRYPLRAHGRSVSLGGEIMRSEARFP